MSTKSRIAIFIVITISWIIVYEIIKGKAKKLSTTTTKSSGTTLLSSDAVANNVAEVKRYYITNSTDTIPSGQAWVRVRNCNSVVGKIDFGGGYSDLEESGSTGDTYYQEFSRQGKVSPKIMLDATGTKFLVEYAR